MNQSYYDYFKCYEEPNLILPKGKTPIIADIYGDYGDAPKCSCGVEKVYGPNCPPEYHSHFCPKSKETP